MRDANVFGIRKALPRMSWSPQNLYNLWRRSSVKKAETTFNQSEKTLFQQRWASKRLTRAYHGDYINEKIFKRWYLPGMLPDVRPRRRIGDDKEALAKFAQQHDKAAAERKAKEEEERQAQAPVASLMWTEVERRIDVFIFRCCFAHSVYEARRLVIHGYVLLNGRRHQNANTRLAPGDMVSVDPKAIRFLQGKPYEHPTEGPTRAEGEEAAAQVTTDTQTQNAKAALRATDTKADGRPSKSVPHKWTSTLTPFNLPDYAAPSIFIPSYIEVSFLTCTGVFLRYPTARNGYSEIPTPYEADGEIMRLTWEWYSKHRSRMTSRSQLARMPENRKERRVIPLVRERPRHLEA